MRQILLEFNGSEAEYQRFIEHIRNNWKKVQIIEEKPDLSHIIRANELILDQGKRQVIHKNELVNLTTREFDILYFMASNPGCVFSHRQIYEAVWKKEYYRDTANITAHIGHIRKKIEPDTRHPIYIKTVHGVGYKFSSGKG